MKLNCNIFFKYIFDLLILNEDDHSSTFNLIWRTSCVKIRIYMTKQKLATLSTKIIIFEDFI